MFCAMFTSITNPWNSIRTTITFDIPGEPDVKHHASLIVYNLRGRRVTILVDEEYEPGSYQIVWDGKNEQGQQVSSGVYLYTLKSGNLTYTKKMAVVE